MSGVSYPKRSGEYQALLDAILDEKGRFPGDAEALTPAGTYASRLHGTKHFTLNRGPLTLQGEMLSPAQHAPGLKNRFVFDADLVTQTASFDSYGTLGVSYAKEAYYVEKDSTKRTKSFSFVQVVGPSPLPQYRNTKHCLPEGC